jgi:endonuclease YncB( thermonuclease family)
VALIIVNQWQDYSSIMQRKNKILVLLFLFLLEFTACNRFQVRSPQLIQELENQVQPETATQTNTPIYMQFYCVNPGQPYQTARVVKVIDGDSIVVKIEERLFEVRYIGINSPEYDSDERAGAILATQANERMLFGQEVVLFKDISNTDKFGRLLRYVFTENEFVNLELVRKGFAESRAYPPDTACQFLFENSQN